MSSELDLTLGAAEIGALAGSMLYSAVTVQMYTYSGRCKGDPMWLIVLVSLAMFLHLEMTQLFLLPRSLVYGANM